MVWINSYQKEMDEDHRWSPKNDNEGEYFLEDVDDREVKNYHRKSLNEEKNIVYIIPMGK